MAPTFIHGIDQSGLSASDVAPLDVKVGEAAAAGSAADVAREDHRHAPDANLATQAELDAVASDVSDQGLPDALDDRRIAASALVGAASAAAGIGEGIAVRPNGENVALAIRTTEYAVDYDWTGATWSTKRVPTADALPGIGRDVAWSPDGTHLVFVHSNPGVHVKGYPVDADGVFGTGFVPGDAPPAGGGKCVQFHPDGLFVATGHSSSPYLAAIPFDSGTPAFGTPVVPAGGAIPSGPVADVAWLPDGSGVMVATETTPYLQFIPWTGSAWGTAIDVGSALAGQATSIAVTPDGNFVITGHNTAPYLSMHSWNGSAFGSIINPDSNPGAAVEAVAVSPSGDFVVIGHGASPYNYIYGLTIANKFGTRTTGTTLAGICRGVAFSPDGSHVFFAIGTTPYAEAYPVTRTFGF